MLLFFFFNDTATTEIYTLSLHDALPISPRPVGLGGRLLGGARLVGVLLGRLEEPAHLLAQLRRVLVPVHRDGMLDRKSTRLNSSHANISYAVFCLKKKQKITLYITRHST